MLRLINVTVWLLIGVALLGLVTLSRMEPRPGPVDYHYTMRRA